MNIETNRPQMIFSREHEGRKYYTIGLSKKNQDETYTKGYMNCQFKKGVEVDNQTKIVIKKAWLDFYLKDKITVPYIFISEFEVQSDAQSVVQEIDTNVQLTDEDLPF